MSVKNRMVVRFWGMVLAGGCAGAMALGQTMPQSARATPAPAASNPSATRPKRPSVSEIRSKKTVDFDFEGASVSDILTFMGKSYDVKIEYAFEDRLTDLLTIKRKDVSEAEAVKIMNLAIQSRGYAIVESVRDDEGPPRVALTVLQTKKDAGREAPVYSGNDPEKIPEGNELRTQIITVKNVDLEKHRGMIESALSKDAEITIKPEEKTLIVTDTSTHVHTLVFTLQVLEKLAASDGK